ncbi:hypothetical protein JCM5350_005375 [Sporobolomyces pararoseus]
MFQNEIDWYFSQEEIARLRSKDTLNKVSDDGLWRIELAPGEKLSDEPFARITALPQENDFLEADSARGWRRGDDTYTCSFKLLLHVKSTLLSFFKGDPLECRFDSSTPTASKECRYDLRSLLKEFKSHEKLGLRCTISSSHVPLPTSPSTKKLLSMFDTPACADTVFTFFHEDEPDREPTHIFACKAILSASSPHFKALLDSNQHSTKQLDLKKKKPEHHEISQTIVEEELKPFFQSKAVVPAGENSRKRIKLDESVEAQVQESEMKNLTVIEVHERDFRTFYAMIYFLHTSHAPFYSITSNYLVESFKDREPNDSFEKYSDSPSEWIKDKLSKGPHSLDERVVACSPYEMYRLANRYGIEELKSFVLNFISESLNHENVAYELFSPLSLEFKPVRQSVLEFFIDEWDDVKNTKGFNVVLDKFSSGQLSEGRELMSSIFNQLE